MAAERKFFLTVRLNDSENKMVDLLAQRLERKRGDAVRYVVRQAARELNGRSRKVDRARGTSPGVRRHITGEGGQ